MSQPEKNIQTFAIRGSIYKTLATKKLVLGADITKVSDLKKHMDGVIGYINSVRQYVEPDITRAIASINNSVSNLITLMDNKSIDKENRKRVKAETLQALATLRDSILPERITNIQDQYRIQAYDADPMPGAPSLKPVEKTYMSNSERRNLDRANAVMREMQKFADKVPKHIVPKYGYAPFECPLIVMTKPAMDDDKMKAVGPDFKFFNMYHYGYIWMNQLLIGVPREITSDKDQFRGLRTDIINNIRKINKENYVDMTLNDQFLTVRGSSLAFFWLMRKQHYLTLKAHTNFKIERVSFPFDTKLGSNSGGEATVEALRSLRQNLEKEITDNTKDKKAERLKAKIELKEIDRRLKEISSMKMYKYIDAYTKTKKKEKITDEEVVIAKELMKLRKRRRILRKRVVELENEIDKITEEVTERVRGANKVLGSNFDPAILANPTLRKLLLGK